MDTEEKTTVEDLTTNQQEVDYAFMDGEVSEQEYEDMTRINYLMGLE